MLDRIFKLGKETAIYGLSSIVGRLINFLLVPVLTNFLTKQEVGIYGIVYSYIAFVFVIYGYGMDSAYMRFVASMEIGDKRQNLSAPFFSLVGSSIVFSLLIYFSAASICALVGLDSTSINLIRYSAWILFFDTVAIVPFASLRMDNKAKLFAGLRVLNILAYIVVTVVLLVVVGMHIEGVFIANLIASASTAVVLFGLVFRQLTIHFPSKLYKGLLRFGLPYIPASLAGIAIQVIDRPILKALTNEATVGVYTANYRLGILMMLVVGMFDYAWRPFFLTHAKDSDAPKLFSKVFTYFAALMMLVFLLGTMFISDIVRIRILGYYIIKPDYWEGLTIVPIVLLAYVFMGAYVNFVAGVYLEKKTKYLPYATGAGAIVNVAANYFLIPRMGIMGAAIATLLSYIVMAIGIYFPSQRFYRVEYEWGRIIRLGIASGIVTSVYLMLNVVPATLNGTLIKSGLTVLFVILVFGLRVFDSADIKETKEALTKMFTR